MPHFFIKKNNIENKTLTLSDEELYNHLVKARRVMVGEKVLFIDEAEVQYETIISKIDKKCLFAEIIKSYKSNRKLDIDLTVARCVLKQDADYSSIQKATELGVKTIIPLISDNCALKESVIKAKTDKFQKIADESVKQCERADFPIVMPPKHLDDFISKDIKNFNKILVFSEREEINTIKNYFKNNPYRKGDKILAIIGCEGGFSKREFDIFEKYNLTEITLGKLILRADTALTAAIFGIISEVNSL